MRLVVSGGPQGLGDAAIPVDTLVNNAGIGLYDGTFAEHAIADEEQMIAVNVRAVMRLTPHGLYLPLAQRVTKRLT